MKSVFLPKASRKALIVGIGKQHLRYRRMHNLREKTSKKKLSLPLISDEKLPPTNPDDRYQMSHEQKPQNRINIITFQKQHKGDLAVEVG